MKNVWKFMLTVLLVEAVFCGCGAQEEVETTAPEV